MAKINPTVVVFWFRRDLRLEDNAGLYHALQSGFTVLPVFIFDTDILSQLDDKHDRRVDFIHQVLTRLQNGLETIGSSLCVKTGKPLEVFNQLLQEFDVKAVYTNRDYETYALDRDAEIKYYLLSKNIELNTFKDQVIFEHTEVLKANGEPYTVFTPYSKIWKQKLTEKEYRPYPSEKSLNQFVSFGANTIPSLEEIGFLKTEYNYTPPTVDQCDWQL